jgi:hypothetical protein
VALLPLVRSWKLRCARSDLGGQSRFWRALEAALAYSGLQRLALLGIRLPRCGTVSATTAQVVTTAFSS